MIERWCAMRVLTSSLWLIAMLASSQASAAASNCGASTWIVKFSDDATGCLSDYPQLTEASRRGENWYPSHGLYSVALSIGGNNCPSAIGVGMNIGTHAEPYASARDEAAVAQCRRQLLKAKGNDDCRCAVVIKDGSSTLEKGEFSKSLNSWSSQSKVAMQGPAPATLPPSSIRETAQIVPPVAQHADGPTASKTAQPNMPPPGDVTENRNDVVAMANIGPLKRVQPTRKFNLAFDSDIPSELLHESNLRLNGYDLSVDIEASSPRNLVYLGNELSFSNGLTILESAKGKWLYWREDQELKNFAKPYKNSAAILVAIDDYDRVRDTQRRGKTNFSPLQMMVERSRDLKKHLLRLGFQEENIIELYNEAATSTAMDSALKSFWRGGRRQNTDRLFFYFGGHGTTADGIGLLVTYDFDPKVPTQTGFLMRDLATRHTDAVTAKHMFVAIDACASGLTLHNKLDGAIMQPSRNFRKLSLLRRDTEERARNFLVAGTDDQPALYENGGIFTNALIGALSGAADTNGDGVLTFPEVSMYVQDEVAVKASLKRKVQKAKEYVLDANGAGKVLFVIEAIN